MEKRSMHPNNNLKVRILCVLTYSMSSRVKLVMSIPALYDSNLLRSYYMAGIRLTTPYTKL